VIDKKMLIKNTNKILFCVAVFLLSSCSKDIERTDSIKLIVDEKTIFEEKNWLSKSSPENRDINSLMIRTCYFSEFLGVSLNKTTRSQYTKKTGSEELSGSKSDLKIGLVPANENGLIVCTSSYDDKTDFTPNGCQLIKSNKNQYQYTLELLDLLKSKYGMKKGAIWIRNKHSDLSNHTIDYVEKIIITNENFACERIRKAVQK